MVDHVPGPGSQRAGQTLTDARRLPRRADPLLGALGLLQPSPHPPPHQHGHQGRRDQAQDRHLGPEQRNGEQHRVQPQFRGGHQEGHGRCRRGASLYQAAVQRHDAAGADWKRKTDRHSPDGLGDPTALLHPSHGSLRQERAQEPRADVGQQEGGRALGGDHVEARQEARRPARACVRTDDEHGQEQRQRQDRSPSFAAAFRRAGGRTVLMDHDMHERPPDGGLVEHQRPGIGDHPGHGPPEHESPHRREHEGRQRGDSGPAIDFPGHQPPDRDTHRETVQYDGQGKRRGRPGGKRGQRRAVQCSVNDESGQAGQQGQAVGRPGGAARGSLGQDGNQKSAQESDQNTPLPFRDRSRNERQEDQPRDRRPGQAVEHGNESAPVAGARVEKRSGGEGRESSDQIGHVKVCIEVLRLGRPDTIHIQSGVRPSTRPRWRERTPIRPRDSLSRHRTNMLGCVAAGATTTPQ